MSTFVAACRREWSRLGVPDAVANEMAADLEADLAEADAEGASPEEVLGNGYFDPESFVASWATAKGVVSNEPRVRKIRLRRPWALAAALGSAAVALVGLTLLVGPRHGSASVAVVAFRHPNFPPVPRVFASPPQFFLMHQGGAFALFGLVLFIIGLIGLAATLWIWRPWSTRRSGSESNRDIAMPSYL